MGPSRLLVLQYHSGDSYATKATEARVQEYKVKGFPSMFFNGGNVISGGSEQSYNQYSKLLSSMTSADSFKKTLVNINGTFSATDSNPVNATVNNLGSSEIKSARLMAVIFEDLGTSEHRYTVREVLTPAAIASLQPQMAQKFGFKPAATGRNLKAVIFLQAPNGEILQSTLVNLSQ
jgi:hypothetical protein